jgi:hypothetical protein
LITINAAGATAIIYIKTGGHPLKLGFFDSDIEVVNGTWQLTQWHIITVNENDGGIAGVLEIGDFLIA